MQNGDTGGVRNETVLALRALLRTDPSVAQSSIPGILARLKDNTTSAPAPATYFGVAEAARYASTSRWTVRRWIRDGRLKAARVGGLVRIRRADIDSLLSGDSNALSNSKR